MRASTRQRCSGPDRTGEKKKSKPRVQASNTQLGDVFMPRVSATKKMLSASGVIQKFEEVAHTAFDNEIVSEETGLWCSK